MLAAADDDGGQQHVRLAVGLGLEKRHDGELADIVFGVAHQRFEKLVGDLDLGEIEVEQFWLELFFFSAAVSG